MVEFEKGYTEDYNAEDFEQAAKRLLGERLSELKTLNSTPAQICNEFGQQFFGGLLTETTDNRNDITLMLTVSADIYIGQGFPSPSEPNDSTKEAPFLAELLLSDITPDRR